METLQRFEEICEGLTSNKIIERKKSIDKLLIFIQNENNIEHFNNDDSRESWNTIVLSVHKFLSKETEKALEDLRKKGIPLKVLNSDIFFQVVRIVVKEGKNFDVSQIVHCIINSLENEYLNKCFGLNYMNTLKDVMLPNSFIRNHINADDWAELFMKLKFNLETRSSISELDLPHVANLALILKYGPFHSFPAGKLREQFFFITKFCNSVSNNLPRALHEAILEVAYHFCIHTAKDNRMACCKLGEDVFHNMASLYEINTREDKVKVKLIKFFLLQFVLHHPKGIKEGHAGAYAYCWETWNSCIDTMYTIMQKDITFNIRSYHKNTSLFLTQNGIKLLLNDFGVLFAEVVRQVYLRYKDVVKEPNPSKRQKIESPIKCLINSIQETQDWPWINVTSYLLQMYGDKLKEKNILHLLRVLSRLQVDCKDSNITHHIYGCLSILNDLQLQLQLNNRSEVNNIWKVIGDTTLRAFGLNQNDEEIHNLLRKMIAQTDILPPQTIFQTYTSGILNVTEYNVETLSTALTYLDFPYNPLQNKILIQWLLNITNLDTYKHLSNIITAKVLVSLIVKQWPVDDRWKIENKLPIRRFEDIGEIYMITAFENGLISNTMVEQTCITESKNHNINVDTELKAYLEDLVKTLVGRIQTKNCSVSVWIHLIAMIKNIISYMLNFKILREDEVQNHCLLQTIGSIWNHVNTDLEDCYQKFNERELTLLNDSVSIINKMLSTDVNKSFNTKFTQTMPLELLKTLVAFLKSTEQEKKKKRSVKLNSAAENLRIETIKTLTSYCYGFTDCSFTQQQQLLEVLVNGGYMNGVNDFEMPLIFLETLMNCKPANLMADSIYSIISLIIKVSVERYRYYSSALRILQILYDIFPYVATCDSSSKSMAVRSLGPFYEEHLKYGPKFAVALVNCMGKLYEIDPKCEFAKWDDTEIVLHIPEFLCSDYQEVRFAALRNILCFFKISSSLKDLTVFHLQEIMFSKICDMCDKIFEVTGSFTEERKIDETVTRSASVLHTLSAILITSNLWREESLFILLEIVHKRRLESFPNVLKMVATELFHDNEVTFLEKYLQVLIRKWIKHGHTVEEFPVTLFGCDTKPKFYSKYLSIVVPFIIQYDMPSLQVVAEYGEKSLPMILEESFPKLLADCIVQEANNLSEFSLKSNALTKILLQHFDRTKFEELIKSKIDQALLHLIMSVRDEDNFLKQFGTVVMFTKSETNVLTVATFLSCIEFIENIICKGENLLPFILRKYTDKIQRLTMQLNLNIYESTAIEDKMKYFHHYTIMMDLVIENLISSNLKDYFIRDVCFILLQLVTKYEKYSQLSIVAAIYLKKILVKLLPTFSNEIRVYFASIITILKDVSMESVEICDHCVGILDFLVIENKTHFKDLIKELDPFPATVKFEGLNRILLTMKYAGTEMSLNEEIYHFLNFGKNTKGLFSREEGLRKLNHQLRTKKLELKRMYAKLKELKGFSEDCENSLLHQLISMLVKLSCSNHHNVSIEAVRCLGELGPADLMTLVVQPETRLSYVDWTPFELATGQIISILNLYLVDSDVRVIAPTAEALYDLMNIKEGRKVTESNDDFGYEPINKKYLIPFYMEKKTKSAIMTIDVSLFSSKIIGNELWCPQNSFDHSKWIKKLVCALLETIKQCYMTKLIPICQIKVEFCEMLLPSLIYVIISLNNKEVNDILSSKINYFFIEHWRATIENKSKQESIVMNKASVQSILNVVHFVRVNKENTKFKRELQDLNLDYLKVAQAAQYCTAHFTSLLYIELWCQSKIEGTHCWQQSGFNSTMLDIIFETENHATGIAVQNILRSAYKAIGDSDALQGCGSSIMLNPQHRVEYYKESQMWDQVILFYSMQLSQGDHKSSGALMESLKHCGLYELPVLCSQSQTSQYECLWRLGQWDVTKSKKSVVESSIQFTDALERTKYFCLQALHENDDFQVHECIKMARLFIIEKLKHTSLESSKNLYLILVYLQSLNEIEDFVNVSTEEDTKQLFDRWKCQDEINRNTFCYVEPIRSQRIVLLNDYFKRKNHATFKESLITFGLDLTELARNEDQCYISTRTLNLLQNLPGLSENDSCKLQLQNAQLCWKINDKTTAQHILKLLYNNEDIDVRLRSMVLKLHGKWLVESYSENRHIIIRDYFLLSLTLYESLEKTNDDLSCIFDTYDVLGRFADREYQQITSHIDSDLFQRKIQHMQQCQETAKNMARKSKPTQEESRTRVIHEKHSKIDLAEIENTKTEKDDFLQIALKYYIYNLRHSDENNLRIYRVMALFLENKNKPNIKKLIQEYFPGLPTYKFLTILPQIIPHISESNNEDFFCQQINSIVERCAIDHPHHTLPIVLTLANSNKDFEYINRKSKIGINDDRIQSACSLIKKLKRNPNLVSIMESLEKLSDALIQLAYFENNDSNQDKSFYIPSNFKIRSIKNFENIMVPTDNLIVHKNADYKNIIGISSFKTNYSHVGGVSKPKKLICIGTDGRERKQLLKGKDDLRQDAVMQQVFTIMNALLAINKHTSNLLIKTYKVVPLSLRSGILEWAENTMPIGQYLTGDERTKGAHEIYRPKDWSHKVCRKKIGDSAQTTPENKLKIFYNICEHFKPVFHKFFETTFLHPTVWYERRRAYIHSVATTSMCGYILGIGDRHVSNILIDKATAEVVHIDFGIAFEQGRLLRTAETVPFRLTRDFVDGMGVSGVQGAFRRSCEKTMMVLRENTQTIVTILEVLLYDPLYTWTVSRAEANKRQHDEHNESTESNEVVISPEEFDGENAPVNVTVERAILRLKAKLQGIEDGKPTSIDHQVGVLIQKALDPSNLCKLYSGWQAYL